ncbi:MAG TPA: hypothetical protein VF030_09300, partial [Solirubrobacterales bacterium]
DEAFSIYGQRAGALLPVAFWMFLLVAIVSALASETLALVPLEFLVSTFVSIVYQGMVVGLIRDLREGRGDSSIAGMVRQIRPVLWPLIGAGLLAGLGIGLGALLIVPGIYLFTIWAVVAPAIVIERRGVRESFGRSRQLVRGNGWQVLGALVVALLFTLIATLVLSAIAAAITSDPIFAVVVLSLALTLAAPIMSLVVGVLYFRLREIEEKRSVLQQPGDSLG